MYNTIKTINYGNISIRNEKFEYTGTMIDSIDLCDPYEYAIIYKDNKTNQPFAIIYKD